MSQLGVIQKTIEKPQLPQQPPQPLLTTENLQNFDVANPQSPIAEDNQSLDHEHDVTQNDEYYNYGDQDLLSVLPQNSVMTKKLNEYANKELSVRSESSQIIIEALENQLKKER